MLRSERGERVEPAEYDAAATLVVSQCRLSATPILRHWGSANPEQESMDVANSFFVELRTNLLKRNDGRPVHPYAFQAMRYLCMAAMKANSRFTRLPDDCDPASGDSPLLTLIEREERELLRQKVKILPPKQREAAERLCRAGRERGRRSSRSLTQRDHGSASRARRRLKKWLGGNPDLGA